MITDRYGYEIIEGDTVYIDIKCKHKIENNLHGYVVIDDEIDDYMIQCEGGIEFYLDQYMSHELIKINTFNRQGKKDETQC